MLVKRFADATPYEAPNAPDAPTTIATLPATSNSDSGFLKTAFIFSSLADRE